ncbi:hypothetical protein [Moumouvirus maliensis]|nr:hypothetical protein [Moumouvirus maliensis]
MNKHAIKLQKEIKKSEEKKEILDNKLKICREYWINEIKNIMDISFENNYGEIQMLLNNIEEVDNLLNKTRIRYCHKNNSNEIDEYMMKKINKIKNECVEFGIK